MSNKAEDGATKAAGKRARAPKQRFPEFWEASEWDKKPLGDFAIEWIDLLPEPPEHVVFIGNGFDREALRRAMLDCVAVETPR